MSEENILTFGFYLNTFTYQKTLLHVLLLLILKNRRKPSVHP